MGMGRGKGIPVRGQQEQGGVCVTVCGDQTAGRGEPWAYRGEKVGSGRFGWRLSSTGETLTPGLTLNGEVLEIVLNTAIYWCCDWAARALHVLTSTEYVWDSSPC